MSKKRQDMSKAQALYDVNIDMNMGKLPPQALEIEVAVLGALLLEKNSWLQVSDKLVSDSFYKDAHKRIFSSIARLHDQSGEVDILTVTNDLNKTGELETVGGAYYVATLTNKVVSSSNIEAHALILREKQLKRELIQLGYKAVSEGFDDMTDVFDALEQTQSELTKIQTIGFTRKRKTPTQLLRSLEDKMNLAGAKGGLIGIDTGIKYLNKIMNGWQAPNLIIVGGRPGMGKTAATLGFAESAADDGKRVDFFSLEMTAEELTARRMCMRTGYEYDKIQKNEIDDWGLWNKASNEIENQKGLINIEDEQYTLNEIVITASRNKVEFNTDLIIIDYLQLMEHDSRRGNREGDISTISRRLKQLAKSLNVPIILLSQLSRDVEKRGAKKKPQMSDLRESGSIEQDADIVLFIYRAEYYGFREESFGQGDERSSKNRGRFILAKNRNGATGEVPVNFDKKEMKFKNYTHPAYPEHSNLSTEQSIYKPGEKGSMPDTGFSSDDDDDLPF